MIQIIIAAVVGLALLITFSIIAINELRDHWADKK